MESAMRCMPNHWKNCVRKKRRGLTKPEQELLLNYLRTHPTYNHWHPIFAVMIGTGLRVGEVAGLRWCDIDLEEGMIDVNHTLVYYDHRDTERKQGCYFKVHTTKTKAGVRQVPMLDFVKEAFLMEREYQREAGIQCKVVIDGYTDFIFVNREGGTYYQGTLNKTIRRIIRDCNDGYSTIHITAIRPCGSFSPRGCLAFSMSHRR